MKKLFVLVISIAFLFSCQKPEKFDPQTEAFMNLRGKYLVCDSIKTLFNGSTSTEVVGKGKGRDMTFGLYANLEIHSSPMVYKMYQYEAPDKILYTATSANETNPYYTIQSINGNKIVLIQTEQSTGKILTKYFTAE